MGIIVSIILLFIGLLCTKKMGTWVHPGSIICFLWAIVSFGASLRLFGLNEVSFQTWFVILIGTISFVCGAYLKIPIDPCREVVSKQWADNRFYFNHKWYIIIYIFVLFSLVSDLKMSISLMQQGYGLDVIRQASMGMQEINGYVQKNSMIWSYLSLIRSGFQTILIAVGIERFFLSEQHNVKYLLATIVLVVADAFSNGGRWGIVYLAIEFMVCYAIVKRAQILNLKKILTAKIKIISGLIVIGIAYLMDKVTLARMSGGAFEHFYVYLCGCVPLFDVKKQFMQGDLNFTMMFSSQYGVWSFIMPLVKWTFGNNPAIYENARMVIQNKQVFEFIGERNTYNAFASCYYTLFADFSWIGVCLGMFVFGAGCGALFRKAVSQKDAVGWYSITPYLIASQMIIKTIQNYPLESRDYVVTAILLIIIYRIQNRRVYQK